MCPKLKGSVVEKRFTSKVRNHQLTLLLSSCILKVRDNQVMSSLLCSHTCNVDSSGFFLLSMVHKPDLFVSTLTRVLLLQGEYR